MKVIFLDFDGVLNSAETLARGIHLDPEKVIMLRNISDETDANIVVSSTWRIHFNQREIRELLYRAGFKGRHRVIGSTPDSRNGFRGAEIEAWLKDKEDIEKYVIIDDGSDFYDYQRQVHVTTNFATGLTERDVEKAIEILNKQFSKQSLLVDYMDVVKILRERENKMSSEMKVVALIVSVFLVCIALIIGPAGCERYFASWKASAYGSDWLVVQYSQDGDVINSWELRGRSVGSESQSDGIYFKDNDGNIVHLSGHYIYIETMDFEAAKEKYLVPEGKE